LRGVHTQTHTHPHTHVIIAAILSYTHGYVRQVAVVTE